MRTYSSQLKRCCDIVFLIFMSDIFRHFAQSLQAQATPMENDNCLLHRMADVRLLNRHNNIATVEDCEILRSKHAHVEQLLGSNRLNT